MNPIPLDPPHDEATGAQSGSELEMNANSERPLREALLEQTPVEGRGLGRWIRSSRQGRKVNLALVCRNLWSCPSWLHAGGSFTAERA